MDERKGLLKDTEVETPVMVEEDTESNLVISFSKPFKFEGEEYNEVDLSGLHDMTTADLIAVDNYMKRKAGVEFMQEITIEYACVLASKATKKPIEFFYALPAKYALRVKNRIVGFLFGAE